MLSDSWETGHCAVGGHWCGQAGVVLELWSSYNGALKGTLSWSASRWSSFGSLDKRHSKLKLVEIGGGCSHFLVTCHTAVLLYRTTLKISFLPHHTVSPHHLREARTSGMVWGKTATKAARIVSLRSVTLFPLRQKHRSSAPHPSGHTEVIHCHGLAQTQKLASVIVAIRVHCNHSVLEDSM